MRGRKKKSKKKKEWSSKKTIKLTKKQKKNVEKNSTCKRVWSRSEVGASLKEET